MSRAPWLLLHSGALGDLVLTLQLAMRYAEVQRAGALDVIARIALPPLQCGALQIRFHAAESVGLHALYADEDVAPSPTLLASLHRGPILSALGGAGAAVTHRLRQLAPRSVYSIDPRPTPDARTHITDQWSRHLAAQGLLCVRCSRKTPPTLRLDAAASTDKLGVEAAAARNAPVVIHPGSGGREKCWPLPNFVAVARKLRTAGHAIRFLLGEAEQERWPADVRAELAAEFPVGIPPTVAALAAELAAARAFLGNDSGPTHLAAALGRPTVALFGPTSPEIWRPLGRAVSILAGHPSAGPAWALDAQSVIHTMETMLT